MNLLISLTKSGSFWASIIASNNSFCVIRGIEDMPLFKILPAKDRFEGGAWALGLMGSQRFKCNPY